MEEIQMANAALKLFAAYLDSIDHSYRIIDEEETILAVGIQMPNTKMDMFFNFDDDCIEVGLYALNFATVPDEKFEKMYKTCNDLNMTYTHACFAVDENHNQIRVSDENFIQLETVGEECFEMMEALAIIINNAYPEIMKAIWS